MTPEQYLQLPEEKPYLEFVDGLVLQKPMPNEDHGELVSEIDFHLRTWIKRRNMGRAGVEVRAHLGDLPNFRLPDLSYWRPGIRRGEQAPPTLAVEVRSPDQTLAELRRKCEFLRSTGVEACWLIDPVSRTAELYQGRKKTGTVITALGAERLPDFELSLSDLFAILD